MPSLSPFGFWTLWALALVLYLRARACAQKVGGGGGSSYTGCARKPFFGLNMDELDARILGIISKSYGGLIQNPTCPTARVNLMLALSGTWCSMWLAILRTSCRGHPARLVPVQPRGVSNGMELGPVLGSCRIWQFLVGWSFELIHFLKHETILTRIKPTIFFWNIKPNTRKYWWRSIKHCHISLDNLDILGPLWTPWTKALSLAAVMSRNRWRTKMSQVMGKGRKGWRNIGWWWLRVASWFRSTGFSTCATSCWGVVAHPTLFLHTSCCFMQSLRIVQSGASCNWERCLPWELDVFSGEFLGCKSEFQ